MELIRGISGIRGIVGETLSQSDCKQYARAYQFIQDDGVILVARDNRHHGQGLMQGVIAALQLCGREVLDCGLIPTPTAQFLVEKKKLAGGIVITASHNPIEWNGMKFIDHDGCFLTAEKNQRIFDLVDGGLKISEVEPEDSIAYPQGLGEHVAHTAELSVIDADRIRAREFCIVVDGVNGAGSLAVPAILKSLGCRVIPVHCTPNGYFPRQPEPLPQNLTILSAAVLEFHADMGLALDPDGDRLAIVDNLGRPIGEELTLVLCADGYLQQNTPATPLVTNLSTTMALDEVAARAGAVVMRSAVGEINVVNLMKETGSALGGEGNGGVILPESHYGRDAVVGTAMVLHRLALSEEPLDQIVASLPQFVMEKDKIQLGGLDPDQLLLTISEHYASVEQDRVDGLKLIWPDRWVHIRKSNTEPIIRIYAEAPTQGDITDILTALRKLL